MQHRQYHEIANSKDEIDRVLTYINSLSPHNLWRGYKVIKDLIEKYEQGLII